MKSLSANNSLPMDIFAFVTIAVVAPCWAYAAPRLNTTPSITSPEGVHILIWSAIATVITILYQICFRRYGTPDSFNRSIATFLYFVLFLFGVINGMVLMVNQLGI